METLIQDIRYGWRMLAKSPGFAAVVILMLALGTGANTAVFTIFNATLLRTLPYEKPDELVQVWQTRTSGSFQKMEASYPNYLDMRDHNEVFLRMGGYSGSSATLSGKDGAEQIPLAVASSGFFEVLGVKPALGRTFTAAEDEAQTQAAVVLTYGAWKRRFGGDPQIIGQTIVLDGSLCNIVGVLPKSFQFGPSRSADIWRSLHLSGGMLQRRNLYWFHPIGRLKPGVSLQQAEAGMQTLARQLEAQYPDSSKDVGIRLDSLQQDIVGPVKPVLLMLMASVGFVLLITCANVAGLLLARSVPRQKEIAIRVALGAARGRIMRQLLTESILLALIGGLAGVLVAAWAVPAIISAIPKDEISALPALQEIGIDYSVLLFSLALSVLTGLLFGMAPAFQAFSPNLQVGLQEMGRSSVGSAHRRLRNGLVVAEISVAIVLLVGAGLMLNSLRHVFQIDPGFKSDHLLTLSLALPDKSYPDDPHAFAFLRQLLQKTSNLPGVRDAAAVSVVPLVGGNTSRFDLEGRPKASGGEEYEANTRTVSSNYFRTMVIPLRGGRLFTAQDNDKAPHVVIVNQALADMAFSGQNPIGKRINFTYSNKPDLWEIIGVVGNENVNQLDAAPTSVVYDNFEQDASGYFSLIVRTEQAPLALMETTRRAIREIDPDVPQYAIASMKQIIAQSPSMFLRAYPAYLVGMFAGVALLLAALGIYGLLAYSVAQRTRELGLRMALGAQPRQLLELVVRNGVKLVLIGAFLGVIGALVAGRLISSLLFGVAPTDFMTYAEVCALLLIVVVPATYIPARRATKVDPMVALRYE